jgi:hypothetical protein
MIKNILYGIGFFIGTDILLKMNKTEGRYYFNHVLCNSIVVYNTFNSMLLSYDIINITNTIIYFSNQSSIAKTIDNSLNSGGYLLIWDHYDTIEKMMNVLSSYKLLEIIPMSIEDIKLDDIEYDIKNYGGFDGSDVIMLFKK